MAKFITVLSVFVEIYFLNALLGKDIYGDFIFAVTVTLTVAIIFTNPFRSFILFRSAKTEISVSQAINLARSVFSVSLLTGFLAAIFIMAILFLGLDIKKPDLILWMGLLVWIIPMEIGRNSLAAHFQSQQNIRAMVIFNTILPHMLRMAGLVVIWFCTAQHPIYIVLVFWGASGLPLFIMAFYNRLYPLWPVHVFSKKDVIYITHMIGTQVVQQGSRIIDLLIVGVFMLSAVTAEYAVALKFAAVLLIGKQMTEHLLTPRISGTDIQSVRREYDTARDFGIFVSMAGIVVFALIGHYIIPIFGDYGTMTLQIFFLLAAANLCRTATGCSGEYLAMKGYSAWVFCISLTAVIIAILTAILLMPELGIFGAAIAAIAAALVSNIGACYGCWKTDGFICLPLRTAFIVIIMFLLCILKSFAILPDIYTLGMMSGVFIAFLWRERQYLKTILQYRTHI